MPNTVFECATPKCAYAIDSEGLNKVQLEALRRWAKTCPRCNQRTKWQEKLPLLNTENQNIIGGSKDAVASKAISKSKGQKRRAAGYGGH